LIDALPLPQRHAVRQAVFESEPSPCAVEFLLEHRPGGRLVVFEVEEGWFSALRSISTPERGEGARLVVKDPATGTGTPVGRAPGITNVPGAPRLVDVRAGADQLQIPASLLGDLQEFIVQGSVRDLKFTPLGNLRSALDPPGRR
jgi:hypothetical protein